MAKMMFAVTALVASLVSVVSAHMGRRLGSTPTFETAKKSEDAPLSLTRKSRVFAPYGTGKGLAFGMGAVEQMAYDDAEKYVYAISEQGAVNVIDFNDPAKPAIMTDFFIDLAGAKGTDIEVCASKGWIFVGAGADDKVSNGKVFMYSTVKRSAPAAPTKLKEIEVGPLPDMILPNADCSKLGVANEGEGKIIGGKLNDPQGSAMIVTSLDASSPTVQSVSFAALGTDNELITKGVHLPLPKNAMEYWDEHSDVAADLDFTDVRGAYNSAMNLEPEYLGWSADGTKLYVNLQENSAVVIVDVPASGEPSAASIHAYGLQDWTAKGIDVVKDDGCNLTKYPGLYSMKNPDSIAVVNVDGVDYILTANEGDDKEYGDYEEKQKAKDFLDKDDGSPKFKGMTASAQVKTDYLAQNQAGANSKRRLTVGSSAINYASADAPVVEKLVMFGGRSISIYKASDMSLTWDSGSQIETEGCARFPWAHNGVQDEEFALVNGTLYKMDADMAETIDEMSDPVDGDGCEDRGDGKAGPCPLGKTVDERSPKDGPALESVVSGIACGRLIMVTAGEKNGVLFAWDISDITSPSLLFVDHLSPASQTKSPGIAYGDGSLGEVDPESMIFLDDQHSPSGKAGVLIAGAWSGSVSWWEFECKETMTTTNKDITTSSSAVRSWQPMALAWAVSLVSLIKLGA